MAARMKDGRTRREFVKEVAGVTLAGALVDMKVFAEDAPKAPESKEKLVAPCGLYCGACPMYLSSRDNKEQKADAPKQPSSPGAKPMPANMQCDGCIGGGRVAIFCQKCNMRSCAESKKITRCADCSEFPCSKITNFNNDGMQHHAEVLANSRKIKEVGIKEWTKREEERWSCPQCKATIAWYDKACSHCGAKRSDKLFALK